MAQQTKIKDNKKFAVVGFVSAIAWAYMAFHWSSISLGAMAFFSVIGGLILLSVKE